MRRLLVALVCGLTSAVWAQPIVVDGAVKAGGLWCFPIAGRPGEYRYLPGGLRLGTNERGGPEFSFLRYVENKKGGGAAGESITDAEGGGIIHFLVQMDTPDNKIQRAQGELSSKIGAPAKLIAPVVPKSARYHLVCSVGQGSAANRAYASGNAPIFEGQKIAISLGLDKRESQILYNSFQTATPDVSVVIEFEFEGLTEAYQADVTVDWDITAKQEHMKEESGWLFSKSEVQKTVETLTRNGGIVVTTRGASKTGEAMTQAMVDRATDMLFRKVDLPNEPAAEKKSEDGVLGFLKGLAEIPRDMALNPLGIGSSSAYRARETHQTGKVTFSLNSQISVERSSVSAYNLGDLFSKYGKDPAYFRVANLSDPAFQQREVTAMIDGSVIEDFERFVNNVTVSLRKRHAGGAVTLKEFSIDKAAFKESNNRFTMIYGNQGDEDRDAWLDYDYKVKWSFRDGGESSTDWKTTNSAALSLTPPYEVQELKVDGDADRLKAEKVRYVVIRVEYDQFGQTRRLQAPYKPGDPKAVSSIPLVQKRGVFDYKLALEWVLEDGTSIKQPLKPFDSNLILVDVLPSKA